MKAAFLTAIRQIEIREVPPPAIVRPDDVLLRVATVGVCGSDMHYYRNGRIGSQVIEFPWIVGHECAGTVARVGPEVGNLRVGDRVAVDPLIACGRCDQCLGGRENTCRKQKFLGSPGQTPGAMSEFLVMPERCCFPIPGNVTFQQATLVEPFAIGLYAQRLAGPACSARRPSLAAASEGVGQGWAPPTEKGDIQLFPNGRKSRMSPFSVAILGAGPIGLSVLAALKSAGQGEVYVTDIRDYRLELARKFGATWTGDPHRPDVKSALAALAVPGFDCVFECAGEQETLDQAVEILAPGGKLMIAGIPEGDRVCFSPDLMRRKELGFQNVRRQNGCTRDAIDMVAAGKVRLDAMVTHTFSLAQTAEAFELVADYRDGVVKAMIEVSR
jgi:L-iditol 2-dehydrogenase